MMNEVVVKVAAVGLFLLATIISISLLSINNQSKSIEETQVFFYKYTTLDKTTLDRSTLFLKLDEELSFGSREESEVEYISFSEDNFEGIVSRVGDDDYICSGVCVCDDDSERRRISTISRSLKYLLSATTTILALNIARSHFESECQDVFESRTDCLNIISEVESCEKIVVDENESSSEGDSHSVLFVCAGNYCRSPLCECVFRELPKKSVWEFESCATMTSDEFWIEKVQGGPPDPKTMEVLKNRFGEDLVFEKTARGIKEEDFTRFEYILCMDEETYEDCLELFRKINVSRTKEGGKGPATVVKKLTEFSGGKWEEIPNPYKKDIQAFEEVYEMCTDCCVSFLKEIESSRKLT